MESTAFDLAVVSALIAGVILFGCHFIFARVFYAERDTAGLKESEVSEDE